MFLRWAVLLKRYVFEMGSASKTCFYSKTETVEMSSKLKISWAHIRVKPSAVNIDTVSFWLQFYMQFKLCEIQYYFKKI